MIPSAHQQSVQRADLRVVDPLPHQAVDHRRYRPRQQDQRAHDAAAAERLLSSSATQTPSTATAVTTSTVNWSVIRSADQNSGESRIVDVVVEADELEDVRALEVVLVQADPRRVDDRIGGQHEDRDQRRRVEQVGIKNDSRVIFINPSFSIGRMIKKCTGHLLQYPGHCNRD